MELHPVVRQTFQNKRERILNGMTGEPFFGPRNYSEPRSTMKNWDAFAVSFKFRSDGRRRAYASLPQRTPSHRRYSEAIHQGVQKRSANITVILAKKNVMITFWRLKRVRFRLYRQEFVTTLAIWQWW